MSFITTTTQSVKDNINPRIELVTSLSGNKNIRLSNVEDYSIDYPPENKIYFLSMSELSKNMVENSNNLKSMLNYNQKYFLDEAVKKLKITIELERKYLEMENAEMPNNVTQDRTSQLLTELAYNNIFPDRLSTSIEGGIGLVFKNTSFKLIMELYNSGEIGYIIEDTRIRKLIENEVIFSLEAASERITKFYA